MLLLFATDREARATLKKFNAKPLELQGYYQAEVGHILITGMGSISSVSKLSPVLSHHSFVLNIGIAGSLKKESNNLQRISLVGKYTPFPPSYSQGKQKTFQETFTPNISLAKEGKRLITFDYPLHCLALRETLSSSWDLVDMEGWAIAKCCQLHNKPVILYKIVSDFVESDSSQKIRNVIDELSDQMAIELDEVIKSEHV